VRRALHWYLYQGSSGYLLIKDGETAYSFDSILAEIGLFVPSVCISKSNQKDNMHEEVFK
jgi:hypothetical protein